MEYFEWEGEHYLVIVQVPIILELCWYCALVISFCAMMQSTSPGWPIVRYPSDEYTNTIPNFMLNASACDVSLQPQVEIFYLSFQN
jgi:hypothetical protein